MRTLPVAIQVYSLRDEAARDFAGTMKAVKALGYDGVELAGLYGLPKEEVRRILDAEGLACVSAHVPLAELSADIGAVLDTYGFLGCRFLSIPYVEADKRPNAPGFEPALEEFSRLGAACRARGVTLLYHNHDFEFARLPDGTFGLDRIYAAVPADRLQCEIDTCWVKVAGQDPASYIGRYAGRAPVVHLKDYFKEGEPGKMYDLVGVTADGAPVRRAGRFEFRPLGCGMQYVPDLLEACLAAGTEWVVVEQDASVARTPLEAAEISRKYLRGLGW